MPETTRAADTHRASCPPAGTGLPGAAFSLTTPRTTEATRGLWQKMKPALKGQHS